MQQLYHRELGEGVPLIILHGLFGSSDNWLSLGRRYAENHKVYLLDQRNHGQSFHDDDFSYEAMATDLERFMCHHKIEKADLLGHSMGGKTAMTFATTRPQRVKKLIVADIGPQSYPVRHHAILKALFSIDLKNLRSRKEADEKLGELIPETGIRQFLLKNLARTAEGFGWKMNLPVIASEIEQVGKGLNQNSSYKQPALFIRGGRSDYIRDKDLNLIHSIFGKSEVKTLEGVGHWLHAEKPQAFFDITTQFLCHAKGIPLGKASPRTMNAGGKLLMIPTVIAENTQEMVISHGAKKAILACDRFYVENLRTARRYISSLKLGLTIEDLPLEILDKKTSFEDCIELIQPLLEGKTGGVLSESGCPGVADPGARLVHIAHQFGVKVVPYTGPSSILLALMASGFNGQSFTFHGYLPIDKKVRQQAIRAMEKESLEKNRTQIFMDTPYRNEQLLNEVLKTGRKDTFLCIAKDITGSEEIILSKPIGKWRNDEINLHKTPAIFLIYST